MEPPAPAGHSDRPPAKRPGHEPRVCLHRGRRLSASSSAAAATAPGGDGLAASAALPKALSPEAGPALASVKPHLQRGSRTRSRTARCSGLVPLIMFITEIFCVLLAIYWGTKDIDGGKRSLNKRLTATRVVDRATGESRLRVDSWRGTAGISCCACSPRFPWSSGQSRWSLA